MQPDLLQQLRDIHVPPPPGWWPPAPGWWILGIVLLGILGLLGRFGWRAWHRRLPIRRARALHARLVARCEAGELEATAYAHAANELLKRLYVHGLGIAAARRAADRDWLVLLDRALGEPAFSDGPGRILGADRFTPHPAVDAAALARLVERLLRRIGPDLGQQLR
jgi:hypothetical protein